MSNCRLCVRAENSTKGLSEVLDRSKDRIVRLGGQRRRQRRSVRPFSEEMSVYRLHWHWETYSEPCLRTTYSPQPIKMWAPIAPENSNCKWIECVSVCLSRARMPLGLCCVVLLFMILCLCVARFHIYPQPYTLVQMCGQKCFRVAPVIDNKHCAVHKPISLA